MKKTYILLIFLALCKIPVEAQYIKAAIDPSLLSKKITSIKPTHSEILRSSCSGEIKPVSDDGPAWNRKLINYEKKHTLPPAVQAEKDRKTAEKSNNQKAFSPVEPKIPALSPEIGINGHGNSFDGYTPPDNSIAISNSGYIVSAVNSNLEYYDAAGNFLSSSSFSDFFNDPSLTGSIYDPVVLYDSGADRFFMVILHGSTSATSFVIACFSKSGNPMDGWWYYKLTGNPIGNGLWFDYPRVAVSNNEVYITGNLFTDDNTFNEAILYQIEKAGGYNGESLNWQYWNQITQTPFTIVPASFGHMGNYGPGMFFVSNLDLQNGDKILLFELTNDISGSPEINVYSVDSDFSLAGDALQKGTVVKLNNDDTRVLHAFYLDGIIHFTFHSDRQGGYAGINYNRLNLSTLSLWSSIYGFEGFDYSYPSLASFSSDPADKSVIISFLRSGSEIYPESRVIYCDDGGNWSNSTLVKDGETYVDVYNTDQITRWGDYTGAVRKQNASGPEVWVSGCYGHFGSNEHSFDTWVAQVKGLQIGINDKEQPVVVHNIYPNPVTDIFNIDFELLKDEMITIRITDINGKEIKELFRDKVKKGKNNFSFNRKALSAGNYFLSIQSPSNVLVYEKIIIK